MRPDAQTSSVQRRRERYELVREVEWSADVVAGGAPTPDLVEWATSDELTPEHRLRRPHVVRTLAAPEPRLSSAPVRRATPITSPWSDRVRGSLGGALTIIALLAAVMLLRPEVVPSLGSSGLAEALSPSPPAAAVQLPAAPVRPQQGPSRSEWGDTHRHLVVTTIDAGDMSASLLALPGVIEATQLAPGLVAVAVAAKGAVEDVARLPGVLTVDDDVLLGLAHAPHGDLPPQSTSTASRPAIPALPDGSRRPLVAVIDTGFDLRSKDLAESWWQSDDICGNRIDDDANGFVDDCQGWDFGADDPDPSAELHHDFGDHGTEVASVIAAAPNGVGVVGVAPGTAIMPLKVARPNGPIAMSAVVAAIVYAVDNGAQVINLSLVTLPGVDRSKVRVLEDAIERAGAAGVVVVVGAGNDGHDLVLAPAWPAALGLHRPHVLTVGAHEPDGTRARFSNQGRAGSFGAAGSAVPTSSCAGGTVLRSGTSFAAAIVTGVVASVLAASPTSLDPSSVVDAVARQSDLVDGVHLVGARPVVDGAGTTPGHATEPVGSCRAPEG